MRQQWVSYSTVSYSQCLAQLLLYSKSNTNVFWLYPQSSLSIVYWVTTMCIRDCTKFFSRMILFYRKSSPVKHVLPTFQLWDNWGSEKLGDFSRIIQLVRGWAIRSPRSQRQSQGAKPEPLSRRLPPRYLPNFTRRGQPFFLSSSFWPVIPCSGTSWGNSEVRIILQGIPRDLITISSRHMLNICNGPALLPTVAVQISGLSRCNPSEESLSPEWVAGGGCAGTQRAWSATCALSVILRRQRPSCSPAVTLLARDPVVPPLRVTVLSGVNGECLAWFICSASISVSCFHILPRVSCFQNILFLMRTSYIHQLIIFPGFNQTHIKLMIRISDRTKRIQWMDSSPGFTWSGSCVYWMCEWMNE